MIGTGQETHINLQVPPATMRHQSRVLLRGQLRCERHYLLAHRSRSASIFWMLAFRPLFASPTLRVLGLMGQHLGGFDRGAPAGANGA